MNDLKNICLNKVLQSHNRAGKLVVFCGADGSGKTTTVSRVKSVLKSEGISTESWLMPPSECRELSIFRNFILGRTEREGFDAAILCTLAFKLDALRGEVLPFMERGGVALCDRYVFTTAALLLEYYGHLPNWCLGVLELFPKPDIKFHLHCNAKESVDRHFSRMKNDRKLNEPIAAQRLRNFRTVCEKNDFIDIDTSKCLPDDVVAICKKEILKCQN